MRGAGKIIAICIAYLIGTGALIAYSLCHCLQWAPVLIASWTLVLITLARLLWEIWR